MKRSPRLVNNVGHITDITNIIIIITSRNSTTVFYKVRLSCTHVVVIFVCGYRVTNES